MLNKKKSRDGFLRRKTSSRLGFPIKERVAIPFFPLKKLFILSILAFLMLMACEKEKVIPDPTVTITANPTQIEYNETSTVSWVSTNTDYCTLNGTRVSVTASSTFTLDQTTRFAIVAYGEGTKTAQAEVTVTVTLPPAPVINVTAHTEQLPYYDSTQISWNVTGEFTSITLDGVEVENNKTFATPRLVNDTTFTLRAIGPGGTTTEVISITVGDWTTSPQGLLSSSSMAWKRITQHESDSLTNHQWVERFKLTPEELASSYYFTLQGKKEEYNTNNVLIGSRDYQLIEEDEKLKLKFSDTEIYDIEILNENYLVIIIKGKHILDITTGYYIDILTKTTYSH